MTEMMTQPVLRPHRPNQNNKTIKIHRILMICHPSQKKEKRNKQNERACKSHASSKFPKVMTLGKTKGHF